MNLLLALIDPAPSRGSPRPTRETHNQNKPTFSGIQTSKPLPGKRPFKRMAGKLLRAPNTAETAIAERAEVRFQRPAAEYADLGEGRFRLARRDFQRQYFDIYRHR